LSIPNSQKQTTLAVLSFDLSMLNQQSLKANI